MIGWLTLSPIRVVGPDLYRQGLNLTYRKIANKVNYSHSTLAQAAGRKVFPTWELA
ncbi:hypothetical protein [Nocardia sp. CC201C]|uniref:hypothetical protein n=1 Tax=Nocardia sp. CC201C TaxID=3044575 RepID=UPI0024A86AEC|nr:hypothetical protein [Nocardia sp. CC201C]